MKQWPRDTAFAIGLSDTTLLRLKDLKVPTPDQVTIGYTKSIVRADASRVLDGYLQCSWVWDILSRESLNILMDVVGLVDGDTYKDVYISTDTRNGMQPLPQFVMYQAVMYVPNLVGNEGVSVARSPYAYQSVRLIFNKLVEVVQEVIA